MIALHRRCRPTLSLRRIITSALQHGTHLPYWKAVLVPQYLHFAIIIPASSPSGSCSVSHPGPPGTGSMYSCLPCSWRRSFRNACTYSPARSFNVGLPAGDPFTWILRRILPNFIQHASHLSYAKTAPALRFTWTTSSSQCRHFTAWPYSHLELAKTHIPEFRQALEAQHAVIGDRTSAVPALPLGVLHGRGTPFLRFDRILRNLLPALIALLAEASSEVRRRNAVLRGAIDHSAIPALSRGSLRIRSSGRRGSMAVRRRHRAEPPVVGFVHRFSIPYLMFKRILWSFKAHASALSIASLAPRTTRLPLSCPQCRHFTLRIVSGTSHGLLCPDFLLRIGLSRVHLQVFHPVMHRTARRSAVVTMSPQCLHFTGIPSAVHTALHGETSGAGLIRRTGPTSLYPMVSDKCTRARIVEQSMHDGPPSVTKPPQCLHFTGMRAVASAGG